jgi:hypothetical protein
MTPMARIFGLLHADISASALLNWMKELGVAKLKLTKFLITKIFNDTVRKNSLRI